MEKNILDLAANLKKTSHFNYSLLECKSRSCLVLALCWSLVSCSHRCVPGADEDEEDDCSVAAQESGSKTISGHIQHLQSNRKDLRPHFIWFWVIETGAKLSQMCAGDFKLSHKLISVSNVKTSCLLLQSRCFCSPGVRTPKTWPYMNKSAVWPAEQYKSDV